MDDFRKNKLMTRNLISYALVLLSVSLVAEQAPQVAAPAAPAAAAAQPASAQPQANDHILQDGTPVKLQLSKKISSADAKAGQEIAFEVADDIAVDGITVLHRGAPAIGVVTEAGAKRRLGRAGNLSFSISSVQLADGEKAAVRAVNGANGDSHAAAALISPFFLLGKGGDVSIPKGTEITAFINGDMRLDMRKFGAAPTVPAEAPAPASPAQASLAVESTPSGADIEIDGALVGNTPSTVAVAPGSHQISVKRKGFADWSKSLNVTSGTVEVNAELEQAPAQ